MKNYFLYVSLLAMLLFSTAAWAQQKLPSKTLKDLQGRTVNSASLHEGKSPLIISFWATWCKPCIKELNAISEMYDDLQKETGAKLIAISIDDARATHKVPAFVNAQGWDFEVYLDENGDFKRTMNVVNVPHTLLLDASGKIVYQRTVYAPGDEEKLFEQVKSLLSDK